MPTTRLQETLVIIEARKLIGESLQATFTTANVFSNVRVIEDFLPKITGPIIFLIVVHSYLRGCQTIQKVQSTHPNATIVVLDEQFRSGGGLLIRDTIVHGYWTFHDTTQEILQGIIRAVHRSPSLSLYTSNHLRYSRRKGVQIAPCLLEHPFYKLSRRERELFHLIACGEKIEACAAEMNITKKTACNLREKLMKKFNVQSEADLIWQALEAGLVDLDIGKKRNKYLNILVEGRE